jgi:isoleucyl-tRNA synthetase
VANAIAGADPTALVSAYRAGTATVEVDGALESIGADDLIVSETPRSGWAVATSGPDTIALDLELTPELRRLGLVRDIVRLVQDSRKNAGLEVTDRIELSWRVGGSPDAADAIREHGRALADEVLAVGLAEGEPTQPEQYFQSIDEDLGLHLWLRRAGQ